MEHRGDIKVCNKSFDIAGFHSVLSPKAGRLSLSSLRQSLLSVC
jgi:hypothetical protein